MVECTLLQRVSLENRDTAQIAKRSISRPDVGLLERLFHMSLHVSEQHIITLNTFFSIIRIFFHNFPQIILLCHNYYIKHV